MTTLQEGVEAMTHADAHFIKRNKGEWFESWAVLKILAEGRISTLRVSDGTVSKTDSSVLVNALRTGRSGQVIDYVLERDEDGRPTRLSICESGTTTTLTDPISIDVVRQDFAAFEEALMEAESNASSDRGKVRPP